MLQYCFCQCGLQEWGQQVGSIYNWRTSKPREKSTNVLQRRFKNWFGFGFLVINWINHLMIFLCLLFPILFWQSLVLCTCISFFFFNPHLRKYFLKCIFNFVRVFFYVLSSPNPHNRIARDCMLLVVVLSFFRAHIKICGFTKSSRSNPQNTKR